jgi:signal transduction histidine kinase
MELLQRIQIRYPLKGRLSGLFVPMDLQKKKVFSFLEKIRTIGADASLDDYEKRKLGIFNLLNFLQLVTGILVPLIALAGSGHLPADAWIVATLPSLVSMAVLFMNSHRQYETALLSYFIFYPLFTCFIYINGLNLGVELSFVLYGILSVFFLKDTGYMIFSIGFSMVSYFLLSVVLRDYHYQLRNLNTTAYLVNQGLAIAYIFYGLYLIKRENNSYQLSMMRQKTEIAQQAAELTELNSLKNKLFSVISHDLKAPMYAMRNFFQSARDQKLAAREIRDMLPDVIHDLNYTTGLMENLLHWAKSQMQSNQVRPQELNVTQLIEETIQLLRLQADAKKIVIERKFDMPVYAYADRDMVNLVLRNILSNALKFTPCDGRIVIGTHEYDAFAEIYIQDSGLGISPEQMRKINDNNFYSTPGTSREAGTGLGLMLCKEFLVRNGGRMMIESEPGHGSTFSFTLPQSA